MVWILQFTDHFVSVYEEEHKHDFNKCILLMGNTRDKQWFHCVFSKSGLFLKSKLMQKRSLALSFSSMKGILCIIAKTSKEDFLLHRSIKEFKCWPNEVVTVVRDKMTIPDLLLETRKVYVTDNNNEWLDDLLDTFSRTGKLFDSKKSNCILNINFNLYILLKILNYKKQIKSISFL